MTFADILLCEAVHDVYQVLNGPAENGKSLGPGPRSDFWLTPTGRKTILCLVINRIVELDVNYIFQAVLAGALSADRILQVFSSYGRTGNKNEFGATERLVLVARAHGRTCFYRDRDKGPCSPEVTVDRLRPGVRGGEYTVANCVVACSRHNSQRGDKVLEDYLADSQ
jgi:hypothetical protein